MSMQMQAQVKPTSASGFTPVQTGLLQRKCACGGAAGMSGDCAECNKKKRFGLQTKLKVNEPGDIYEQEADRIADQVMATPARHAVSGVPPRIQRFARQSTGQIDSAPASVDQALASPGRPLEPALRQDMEQRLGHDFSQVRVHTDEKAAESARAVNALAYTVGSDLVFGRGQFAPRTWAGKKLLSHELAHVVQQGWKAFEPKSPLHVAAQDDVLERQAEAVSTDSSNGAIQLASSMQGTGFVQRAIGDLGAQTTGKKFSEDECAGWFTDRESTSKRAAEHYVRTELVGDRSVVEKIECDLFNPDTGAFACTVHFTDGTPIRVIVRKDAIIVGVYPLQTLYPPPERPLCWYDYKCSGPNRDLVLTKRKCQTSKPTSGAPPPKAHGPEP